MTNQEKYNKIKSSTTVVNNTIPQSNVPILKPGNYSEGYIQRYFLQRRDTPGTPIYEVDQRQYGIFNSNPYYKGIVIKWKISGNINDNFSTSSDGNLVKHPSVVSSNRLVVDEAAKQMPDIRMHLVDLKQFWKPLK